MSVITENITINDRQFVRTYSNANRYVVRDGAEYAEAIDPIEYAAERIYTEGREMTDEEPEADSTEAEEILDILLGGAE